MPNPQLTEEVLIERMVRVDCVAVYGSMDTLLGELSSEHALWVAAGPSRPERGGRRVRGSPQRRRRPTLHETSTPARA